MSSAAYPSVCVLVLHHLTSHYIISLLYIAEYHIRQPRLERPGCSNWAAGCVERGTRSGAGSTRQRPSRALVLTQSQAQTSPPIRQPSQIDLHAVRAGAWTRTHLCALGRRAPSPSWGTDLSHPPAHILARASSAVPPQQTSVTTDHWFRAPVSARTAITRLHVHMYTSTVLVRTYGSPVAGSLGAPRGRAKPRPHGASRGLILPR